MRYVLKFIAAAIALLAFPISASHHFETDLSKAYPAYDLTDLYVFDGDPGKTVFILDINPKTTNDGKAAFGESGLYSLHIATDRAMTGGLTLTFRYSNGNMVVGRLDQPNPALGAEGAQLGIAQVGKETRFSNGMRIWAGGAKDPFVGNAAGIVKFSNGIAAGRFDEHAFDNAEDLFGTLFTSAIVIEVPNTMLPPSIHVFASSAMQQNGQWMQVNRLANVLLTHLYLLADQATSTEHVGHRPDEDNQRRLWVGAVVARAATLAKTKVDPVAYGDMIADRLLPDMIPYRVGSPANYGIEGFNGRRPTDDAMDVALSLFIGKAFTDQANRFDHHPQRFPYLVPTESAPVK